MATRSILLIWFLILFAAFTQAYLAKGTQSGKEIFTTVKGPYGTCNTCHPNGGSAGRWDSEYKEISDEGDKVIPTLVGISKRKTPEQIEKAVKLFITKFKVPIKDKEIPALVEYVSSL